MIQRIFRRISGKARQKRAALFRDRFVLDGNTRILDLGAEGGANIHAVDWYGRTPLFAAIEMRDVDLHYVTFEHILTQDDRKTILAALQAGMGKGQMAKCFWPRHGIRVVKDGQATDYVICFECGQVWIRDVGADETNRQTRARPQSWTNT